MLRMFLPQIMTKFQYPRSLFNSVVKEPILNINRLKTAYTNMVYVVTTTKQKYILKIYSKKKYHRPQFNNIRVFHEDEIFKIEEYLESTGSNPSKDYLLVARALRKLHKYKRNSLTTNGHSHTSTTDDTWAHVRLYEDFLERFRNIGSIEKYNLLSSILQRIDKKVDGWIESHYDLAVNHSNNCNYPTLNLDTNSLLNDTICHNDLQIGNILIVNGEAVLIDFETVSKNIPLSEIANYFLEIEMDYTKCMLEKNSGLTRLEKKRFLYEYLRFDQDFEDSNVVYNNEIFDQILEGIELAENYSHLLWYIWSLLFEEVNSDFNHRTYRADRLEYLFINKMIDLEEKLSLLQ